ncbi:MAG: CHASE3 domain-containing protein [Verrucomicrobia bacterium]|nr:CHASE3 domain-containing protein [Verrucomicrobiota bacterium]
MATTRPASRPTDTARLSFERELRWAFWFPVGFMAAIVVILSGQFAWLAYSGYEAKESVREAAMVQELRQLAADSEAGLHDFLTGHGHSPESLDPYRQAEPRIRPLLDKLHEAFKDEPDEDGNLTRAEENLTRWLASAAIAINEPRSGDRLAAELRERQAYMQLVRDELDLLAARTEEQRQRDLRWTQRSTLTIFGSIYALALVATATFIGFGRRQLRNLHEAHRRALEEAEAASEAKGRFMAVLSHELRTPLHAILSWLQFIRLNRGTPKQEQVYEESLDVIERNVNAQAQLVEDLLDLSRLSAGRLELRKQPTNVTRVATEVVVNARPAAQARGIRLKLDAPADSVQVDGDPDRLIQLFGNLLVNAIKFTDRGGQVNVSVRPANDGYAEVAVSDTGRGVSAENLPKLFEPFFLADNSSTRREKGLGLGLAIVRLLTEAHGGSVTAVSGGPGKGTTFTVRLPLPPTHGDQGASTSA